MRILVISLFFVLVGCASYPLKNGFSPNDLERNEITNPYFSDTTKDYIYKTQVSAFDKNFGGILAIKKLGEEHHRLVFTTEMGNTIFDFTFKENEFIVNKILKELDRKILVNILKRDFLAMITQKAKIQKTYKKESKTLENGLILSKTHLFLTENGQLLKIIRIGNGREKVVITFDQISQNVANNILIAHKSIKLRIHLKAI